MNKLLHPPIVFRSVAALMTVALVSQYILLGVIVAVPVATVMILLVLSFTYHKWPKLSAALSLIPGVFIPLLVLLGFLNGSAPAWLLVFDWAIFGWVVVSVMRALLFKGTTHNQQINQGLG